MGWLRRSPSIPSTWRRKIIPACPNCGQAAAPAQHRYCENRRARRKGRADLYLDIATGLGHCIACGVVSPVEQWTHWCVHCYALYEGGEVWQGMAAEVGQIGNLAWLKAAGIQRGTPKITFLGWWFCLACLQHCSDNNLLVHGTTKGGICRPCLGRAKQRLKPWLSLYRTRQPCSWCGFSWPRVRIVRVGEARMCGRCASRMIEF